MAEILINNEATVRLLAFGSVISLLLWFEARRPAFDFAPHSARKIANVGILLIDIIVVRLLPGLVAVAAASWSAENQFGVFQWLNLPTWLTVPAAIVLLDLAIYAQHLVFHYVPLLWRFHAVHHSDPAFDVTTGLRFHPVEIVLSLIYKMAIIALLGCPPEAVILFEILLNASSMFEHSNITLSHRVDSALRRVLVTPSMHRVHHSTIMNETNSNFGFQLSIWDRLFGTYLASASKGEQGIIFGLDEYANYRENVGTQAVSQNESAREPARGKLWDLLKQPF